MKLTPQDIMSQGFSLARKGYSVDEVKGFLLQVAQLLEEEIQEKERMRRELEPLREAVLRFEKREEILRDTLVAAQRFSNEIKVQAEREVELTLKEAELKGEEIVRASLQRRRDLQDGIRELVSRRRELEEDLLSMLGRVKDLVESYRQEDEESGNIEYIAP